MRIVMCDACGGLLDLVLVVFLAVMLGTAGCSTRERVQVDASDGPSVAVTTQALSTPPHFSCASAFHDGHGYWFCRTNKTWAAARTSCQAVGTDLVSIGSAAENAFVRSHAVLDSLIGASDTGVEGAWRWADTDAQFWTGNSTGTAVGGAYANWDQPLFQPDNAFNQDCGFISAISGLWFDVSCSIGYWYVCEEDLCPTDPAKAAPGQCGCGVPDTDTDSDGTPDCHDACTEDPDKTSPGFCGCGAPDADSDGDGELDCDDSCPSDPHATTGRECASPFDCLHYEGLAQASWPLSGGCPQRRGQSSWVGTHLAQLNWEVPFGGAVNASAAIGSDHTVYIGSDDGTVRAIAANGITRWIFTTGAAVRSSPAVGANGMIYVGSDDHNLYALDAATGALMWVFDTGGNVRSSPALGPDGTVYVGSDNNRIRALDGAVGTAIWYFDTLGSVRSSVAIGARGTLFVGSDDDYVYALRPQPGLSTAERLLWKRDMGGDVSGAPAVGFGPEFPVYVTSGDGGLSKLDAATGTQAWRVQLPGSINGSAALGALGRIFVGDDAGKIHAFEDREDHAALLWEFHVGVPVRSAPIVGADGTVYLGADNALFLALSSLPDAAQRVLFQVNLGGAVRSSAAIGHDGAIYVGSGNGSLFSIGGFTETCPAGQSCESFAGINYCGAENALSEVRIPSMCSDAGVCPSPAQCVEVFGFPVCYQPCNPQEGP